MADPDTARQALRDPTLLALLERALALAPEERAAWLAALDDPDRAALLGRLLARAEDGSDLPALDLTPVLGDASAGATPLEPGRRVGAFVVDEPLGQGGMGQVFRATQDSPRRQVALKVLHRAGTRFREEAAVLAHLRHPAIAAVHASGTLEDGRPWLAMELVEPARPFDRWVAEERPDLPRLLAVLGRVCAGVHHAHQRGVIHRDLKGANVLVGADDQPKLIDFGIARLGDGPDAGEPVDGPSVAAAPAGTTRAGELVGSPVCMAPEQARGDADALDIRVDVHALGVLLYGAVCGRPPRDLEGLPWARQLERLAQEPPAPAGPGVDPDLAAVLATALHPERERRYPSAAALADDLAAWSRHEPVAARPPGAWRGLVLLARRRPRSLALTAVLLVALVASLAWALDEAARARRSSGEADRARVAAEQAAILAESRRREALAAADRAEQQGAAAARARDAELEQRQRAEALVAELADTHLSFVRETAQAFGQLAGATELKARFVERAVDELAALPLADAGRTLQAAHARLLLGDVLGRPTVPNLGRRDEALAQYAAARDQAAALADDPGQADHARAVQALVALRVADMALHDGRLDEALALYESAGATLEAGAPPDADGRLEIVDGLLSIGSAHGLAGDLGRAMACFDRGQRLVDGLLSDREDEPGIWLRAGHVAAKRGATRLRQGDRRDAEQLYHDSLDGYARAEALAPAATNARWSAAQSRIALAEVLIHDGRPDEGHAVAERAVSALEVLARADPAQAGYAQNLVDALYNRAWALHEAALDDRGRVRPGRRGDLREVERQLQSLAERLQRMVLPPQMAGGPALVAERLARVREQLAAPAP